MNKKMFTDQFLDLMASFVYSYLKGKTKTKENIKKGIHNFENVWIESIKESKNADRKI